MPNIKLPPEYEMKMRGGMNEIDRIHFQYINGDFGVEELTLRLRSALERETEVS